MPNNTLNYPASSMLKNATKDYKPSSSEYTSFDNSAAASLMEHIDNNIGIKRDAQDANKREWQLRCTSDYNHTHSFSTTKDKELWGKPIEPPHEMLRILVVNGAMTMFALSKAISKAYGLTDKPYNPQPSKGTLPLGSHWTLNRCDSDADKFFDFINSQMAGLIGNQKNVYKMAGKGVPFFNEKKIKVYQLFRKRGDTLTFHCDGQPPVTVCLDGYDQSPTYYKARYTPRCVGADSYLPKWGWNYLNTTLLQNRENKEWYLVDSSLTEEEREDIAHNEYKVPLFDNRGKAIGKSHAGLEEIKELHRAVALPFAE